MNSLLSDITRETVNLVYKETQKKKNQKRISYVFDFITTIAITKLQPYFYSIMAILIVLFLINCFQFFFYFKMMLTISKSHEHIQFPETVM